MRSSVLQGHWTTITSSFLILCNLSLARWRQREARNVTRSSPYHGLVIYLNASYTILPERWKNNENGKEICLENTVSSSWESASLERKGDSWGRKTIWLHWWRNHREEGVLPAGMQYHRLWDRQAESRVDAMGCSQSKTQQPLKGTVPLRVPGAPLLPIRSHIFMWWCHLVEN